MTVLADIVIDAEDFTVGQVLGHSTTPIQLTQFVPVGEHLMPYFWKETGGDESFEERVRADDRVRSLADLNGRVGAQLYHIEWREGVDGFVGALQNHDLLVEECRSSSEGDRWLFRIRAWDQQELSSFQRACHDIDVHLDVRTVRHNPASASPEFGIEGRLSDKQREALVTALEEGYFDVPRGISQTDLAEKVGISRQAFARRLKRGQHTVFADIFWDELDAA
jgi:predicted DNA binding protein